MSRSTINRLQDILHASDLAMRHADGLDAKAFAVAALLSRHLFQIAVIGEAASQLPAELLALAPDTPWSDIRSMRNIINHSYWQIDLVIVMDTIVNDLEPLTASVRRLIDVLNRDAQ